MKRLLRFTLYLIGTLLTLLITAWIVLLFVVDGDLVESQLRQAATEQLGADLSVQGDISVALFPWIAVTAEDLRIADPLDPSAPPFLQIDELDLQARTLALLGGAFELREIVLDGPTIMLRTTDDGRWNWQGFTLAPGGDFDFNTLSLAGVRVTNGRIRFADRGLGFNLWLGPISTSEDAELDLDAELDGTDLVMETDGQARVIPPAAFRLSTAQAKLTTGFGELRARLTAPYAPGNPQVELTLSADGIEGTSTITLVDGVSAYAEFRLNDLDLKRWLADLAAVDRLRPAALEGWTGTITMRFEGGSLDLGADLYQSAGTRLQLQAGWRPETRPCVMARVDRIDLHRWLAESEASDADTVTDFSDLLAAMPVRGQVAINQIVAGDLAMEQASITLGGSTDGGESPGRTAFCPPDPLDSGPLDSGPLDSGPLDSGPLDSGPLDSGAPLEPAPQPERGAAPTEG